MSHQAQTHVMTHSRQKGSHRLVLLIIANHAHGNGTNAFPSMKTLAAESLMSERQVIRIVADLERSGELIVERSRGRHAHNMAINMEVDVDPNPDKMSGFKPASTLTNPVTNPDKSVPPTLTNSAPNPDKSGIAPYNGLKPEEERKNSAARAVSRRRRPRSVPKPLSESFEVTLEMRMWAEAETPGLDVYEATRNFKDYYLGRDGPEGTSTYWLANWKSSMKKQLKWQIEDEKNGRNNGNRKHNDAPGGPNLGENSESSEAALRRIGSNAEF